MGFDFRAEAVSSKENKENEDVAQAQESHRVEVEWLDENPRLAKDCKGVPIVAHIPNFLSKEQLVSFSSFLFIYSQNGS